MNISLTKRIGLCVLSGTGVGANQIYVDTFFDWSGGAWIYYTLSGLLFAAAILFPYLKRDDQVLVRALALVIASTASYFSAEWLAIDGAFAGDLGLISFMIASVAGAAIVLIALVWMTPVRATSVFALCGFVAALIGGPVTYLTLPDDDSIYILLGHSTWHVLICLAIHFGTKNWGRTEAF